VTVWDRSRALTASGGAQAVHGRVEFARLQRALAQQLPGKNVLPVLPALGLTGADAAAAVGRCCSGAPRAHI
jgi:hypothetical protein